MKFPTAENSPEAVLNSAVVALNVLRRNDCSLDDFLDQYSGNKLLRKRLANLLFACFRNRCATARALEMCCRKAPEVEVQDFLTAALTMAAFQDSMSPESVVNIAVTVAKKQFNAAVGRFVNAVLRKALILIKTVKVDPLPPEIRCEWQKNFPPETVQHLAELFTGRPGNTVRLRSGFAVPESDQMILDPLPLDLPWRFYNCSQLGELLQSAEFADGKYYIQDPAPAHVCALLQKFHTLLPRNLTVLDLCAAPGGKLIMNVELLNTLQHRLQRCVAVDRSVRRLDLVRENCLRCKISSETVAGDGADPAIFAGQTFELVTCDVPCSNSGVFRHRPDALWRWRRSDLPEITALQHKILCNAVRLTAVNGLLIYSTCSLEEAENSQQIRLLLQTYPQMELLEEKLFMPQTYCDGTYVAILRKNSGGGQ